MILTPFYKVLFLLWVWPNKMKLGEEHYVHTVGLYQELPCFTELGEEITDNVRCFLF